MALSLSTKSALFCPSGVSCCNSVKSTSSNPQTVKSEPPKMTSKDFSDMIRQKYKTQQAENNKKFSKIFRTSNPNNGNGHWVTMNGAHVFIEDK
jgi:hypothetical protein